MRTHFCSDFYFKVKVNYFYILLIEYKINNHYFFTAKHTINESQVKAKETTRNEIITSKRIVRVAQLFFLNRNVFLLQYEASYCRILI